MIRPFDAEAKRRSGPGRIAEGQLRYARAPDVNTQAASNEVNFQHFYSLGAVAPLGNAKAGLRLAGGIRGKNTGRS